MGAPAAPRRRAGGSSAGMRMLLVICGVSFVFVQVRMLFASTECTDRVKALLESERKWSGQARELRFNLSSLSKQAVAVQSQLEKLQKDYSQVAEALKATEKSLEAHKRLLQEARAARPRKGFKGLDIGVSKDSVQTVLSQNGAQSQPQPQDGSGGTKGGSGGRGSGLRQPKKDISLEPGGQPFNGRLHVGSAPKLKIRAVDLRPQDAVAAVVVMACNRPDYLKRTISSILAVPRSPLKFPLFISQDGAHPGVRELAQNSSQFQYMQHIEEKPPTMNSPNENIAYYRIAEHYKFALSKLFDEQKFQRVIILEDDMELSPDFFDFFEATSDLLDVDTSLMAVSSWNDNGQKQFVADPEAVYRSDFFPGLGWMLRRQLWEELAPKWPKAYWDDWMRLPEHRKGRQFLRPEICRTYNFGEVGSSQGQFYRDFLKPIQLNSVTVNWKYKDLSYLLDVTYPEHFFKGFKTAKRVANVEELRGVEGVQEDILIEYHDESSFGYVAETMGIFKEWKAGIPRTSYRGVVAIRFKGPHMAYLMNPNTLKLPPNLKLKR